MRQQFSSHRVARVEPVDITQQRYRVTRLGFCDKALFQEQFSFRQIAVDRGDQCNCAVESGFDFQQYSGVDAGGTGPINQGLNPIQIVGAQEVDLVLAKKLKAENPEVKMREKKR